VPRVPRTVIFDFGNVLARIDNVRFLSLLTGKPREECRALAERVFVQSSLSRDFETGNIGLPAFQEGVEQLIGVRHAPGDFARAYCEMFRSIPETFALIEALKATSPGGAPRKKALCRVGLLSNTNPLHYEQVFCRFPIADLFDQVTLSYQVGVMKPDERIFRDAADKAGCPPEEILFLDDLPPFVAAARDQGWQAWVFDDPPAMARLVLSLFA